MFYKNGEIYVVQWLVSSYNNNRSRLIIIYYRVEFRKYSVLRGSEGGEGFTKKEQYLDLCLVQIREELQMTFDNQEIEHVELYNYAKVLRVTRKSHISEQ